MQKFFCDNCGTQVAKNAFRCPKCGRYFRSVKCPKCGLAGSPDLFTNGCPSCGYAEERLNENIDYFDIKSDGTGFSSRKAKGRSKPFSDRFYRRILPVLIILFVLLVILLVRTGW